MVLNSTVIANTSIAEAVPNEGANTTRLVVNTTDFNDRDFNEFITITEGMGRHPRKRRSHRRSRNNTIVATMTREELFESTNLDDDQFLNALEHQNSYDDGHSETNPALMNSIENLMKYFDEDVDVNGDSSAKASPAKLKTKGKVASAVASLRSKASSMTPSPLSKRKNKQKLEVKTNIQELKKRYELSPDVSVAKSPKSQKLSPKFLRKSKVRQMASMFNTKLNAIIRKDSPEPQTPEPISPGLESISSPTFTSTLKLKSPKLKPKLPTFIAKLPSPKPSPFFKRRQMQKATSVLSLTGSPASSRKQLQKQPSTTCLVAENVFSQLTVKDKALLYNKFIEDMSKQNPKFSKHAQILESNVQKEIARGEVVVEKQGTVKHLRETLEAKFTPTKVQQLSKTLQRFKRSPVGLSSPATPQSKAKEFEDIIQTPPTTPCPIDDDNEDPLHVSTLTVVLKTSPDSKKYATKPRTTRKKRDVRFHTDVCVIEPSFKRTQEMIRSSLPVEPYAPPKKIRRTQHERLAPRMFFQNQHLEKLFYNWLKEKNGVAFDITPLDNSSDVIEIVPKNSKDNALPKDKIDQMLEEAIKKLEAEKMGLEQELDEENIDKQQVMDDNAVAFKEDEKAIQLIKQTREDEQCLEKSVIEVELPLEIEVDISRQKPPMEDSDLGLTSINKTTSEDSHCELTQPQPSASALKSPGKPMRKKKLRRSITWKKENSLVESQLISTTDSDSDSRAQNLAASATLPKSKKCSNYVKKLFFKTAANSSTCSERSSSTATTPELSIVELDRSLIRQVNSPSKIKTAYTLTVMSSPSPPTESDFCDSDLPPTPIKETSRSLPSLLEVGGCLDGDAEVAAHKLHDKSVSTEFTDVAKNKLAQEQQRLMVDSFIDQGFETGSNDMDSPMRQPKKSATKELDQSLMRQENPKNFSTPLKDKPVHQVFTASKVPPHLISPIPNSHTPMSNHKNLTMQVIKEDCVLDEYTPSQLTPSSLNESASFFAADTTTHSAASPLGVTHKVETSQFWIATGDFTAALNIHHYEPERLMLLSNIFGQKCMDNRDMTFGIDAYKFSSLGTSRSEDIFKKVPKVNNCSQYWFSTGDVVLPFAGKQLSKQKIETFFAYLREFMDDPNVGLRFGIDTYEFSYHQAMLPNDAAELTGHTWTSGSPVKTSDLDQSDLESVELEQSISFSALGGNHSDTASLKSEELINPSQTYALPEDTDALEQIFEDARNLNLSKTQTDKLALETQFTVPEMIKTLQNQQHKLKSLEDRMLSCSNSGFQKNLEHFTESPEYMRKLRSIISAIDNIGRGNGFDACSIEQLESFMFFLSRYADLCLANCTAHIEKILDVVMNQRSFQA